MFLFLKRNKKLSKSSTHWLTAAVTEEGYELPNSHDIQFHDLIEGSDVPDVNKGYPRELHAPEGSHEDSTEGG